MACVKLSDRNHHTAKADVNDPQIQTSQQDAPYQPRVPAGSTQQRGRLAFAGGGEQAGKSAVRRAAPLAGAFGAGSS